MRLPIVAILTLAIGVSACQAEPAGEPAEINESEPGDATALPVPEPVPPGTRLPGPPSPPPPQPSIGGLSAIARTDIERELESGAGCSLDDTAVAGPLLVAVAGDAIVNLDGRIVHLRTDAADLKALFEGGKFTGPGLTIEVAREGEVERSDEVTTWQATLHVRGGDAGFTSYHHRWSCGA